MRRYCAILQGNLSFLKGVICNQCSVGWFETKVRNLGGTSEREEVNVSSFYKKESSLLIDLDYGG